MLVNVPVPPLKFSVTVPSESPLQLTLVVFPEEDISGGDNNVMILVNAHPTESITVIEYIPADRLVIVSPAGILLYVYVRDPLPPVPVAYITPLLDPSQLTSHPL